VQVDRNDLEILDRGECLRLLSSHGVGRVGLSSGALPVILPVNFYLDGERVIVRSGSGTKLAAAMRNAVVCLEVDEIDPVYHSGWSVLVTGTARELLGEEADAARRLPLRPWSGAGDHVIAIDVELVSGRRLSPDHEPVGAR
jgi:uncharacterized protein